VRTRRKQGGRRQGGLFPGEKKDQRRKVVADLTRGRSTFSGFVNRGKKCGGCGIQRVRAATALQRRQIEHEKRRGYEKPGAAREHGETNFYQGSKAAEFQKIRTKKWQALSKKTVAEGILRGVNTALDHKTLTNKQEKRKIAGGLGKQGFSGKEKIGPGLPAGCVQPEGSRRR